jgi:hypothetical protein
VAVTPHDGQLYRLPRLHACSARSTRQWRIASSRGADAYTNACLRPSDPGL